MDLATPLGLPRRCSLSATKIGRVNGRGDQHQHERCEASHGEPTGRNRPVGGADVLRRLVSNSLELGQAERSPAKMVRMGRRISERRMTEPNQSSAAIGPQRELYARLPRPEAFNPTPGEDNLPIPNKLNINSLNPETVEISKAERAVGARIGHDIPGSHVIILRGRSEAQTPSLAPHQFVFSAAHADCS